MDRLEPILPFLRPRSAELTWFLVVPTVLLAVGLVALVALHLVRRWRQVQQVAETFRQQAVEQGLPPADAEFLLHAAHDARLNNPLLILTSVYVFDRHMGRRASQLMIRDPGGAELQTIARIRTVLGFDEVPPDQALRSTRELSPGQTLVLTAAAAEEDDYLPLVVVARDEAAITVAPLLREQADPFRDLGPGDEVAVRFWREGDTEYRFVTEVHRVDSTEGIALLRHVDRVERLQQRDFFRLPVHFDIVLHQIPLPAAPDPLANGAVPLDAAVPVALADAEPAGPAAARVVGEVANASAGGLCLQTADPVPANGRLLIDPEFDGPLPLSGITCEVVHVAETAGIRTVQLRFVDLAPPRESEIMRGLYQLQIDRFQRQQPMRPPADPPNPGTP